MSNACWATICFRRRFSSSTDLSLFNSFNVSSAYLLVFSSPSLNAGDSAFRATVQGLVEQLRALPEVESVVSYYDTNAPEMVSDD